MVYNPYRTVSALKADQLLTCATAGSWVGMLTSSSFREIFVSRQGKDTLFRGAPCLILIHAPDRLLSESDCATASAYLEIALHGLGLGSCWAGMLIEACHPGLPEWLAIPEGHRLYAALMAGIPRARYTLLPFRSAPSVTWREDAIKP